MEESKRKLLVANLLVLWVRKAGDIPICRRGVGDEQLLEVVAEFFEGATQALK